MDVEAKPSKKERKLTRKRRRKYICLCLIAFVLGLGLLFLILGLTVFKAKRPTTNVDSTTLSDVNFSVNVLPPRISINLTLDTDVTVGNPNRVSFKYSNSTAYLRFMGNDVGEVPVPAGYIGSRDTRGLNLTLSLMADRLLSNPDFYSDVVSGTLPLQTYIRISGKTHMSTTTVWTKSEADHESDTLSQEEPDDARNGNRGVGLSEEEISKHIKTRASTQEDTASGICTVCQDDLHEEGDNDSIATLDCGHEYHASCIKSWLLEKNVCPLCRMILSCGI